MNKNLKYSDAKIPIIELYDSVLYLSPKTFDKLNVSYGDRISINYIQISNTETFPVIGKSEIFDNLNNGNKITKKNTIIFKGFQNKILHEYGNIFTIEYFKDNMYRLIPINKNIINNN